MPAGRKLLGQLLVESGVINEKQLQEALGLQRSRKSLKIGDALVKLGYCTSTEVAKALSKQHQIPFVDLSKGRVPEAVTRLAAAELAWQYRFLPVKVLQGQLVVCVGDPVDVYSKENLEFVLGREVKCALAAPDVLTEAIERAYGPNPAAGKKGGKESDDELLGDVAPDDEEAPIIRLVTRMFKDAMDQRASDIHIEPMEKRLRIRFRTDGVLKEIASEPAHLHGPLSSRIKIMANLDIAEKRKPQDGRINVQLGKRALDIRCSVLPSNHGETIVMRLLDKEGGLVSLAKLGFTSADEEHFNKIIRRPNGIVLVTGPTGSGKTTTLYAALQTLNRPDVKIITAEDPVEYHLAGINQVQVRAQIGLTFARILRAMLRQAPNIILVGEIRDRETAEIAIQAALTGHLVFSTLHTNDAPSALVRLIDMGVKPFLVATSVQAILAQRLVRRLCSKCRVAYRPQPSELRAVGLDPADFGDREIYRAGRCPECNYSGFRGRQGVFEQLELDDDLRDMTFRREPSPRIRETAVSSGKLSTLKDDGLRKVFEGITTLDEVLRIIHREDLVAADE
ncbi:MAG: ATPase, T2SS/T4P/T4SS family [Planctomycetota bacterium]